MTQHVLAFDLAARHSAAALLGSAGNLVRVWTLDAGSADHPSIHAAAVMDWVAQIAESLVKDFDVYPEDADLEVVVEDLSHGMANPRPALKLQGALLAALIAEEFDFPTLVFPRTWQTQMGYKKVPGLTTKGWAKNLFDSLDLGDDYDLDLKGKALVDARDAVLIGRWYLTHHQSA